MTVKRLHEIMAELGCSPSPMMLAEALWLAPYLQNPAEPAAIADTNPNFTARPRSAPQTSLSSELQAKSQEAVDIFRAPVQPTIASPESLSVEPAEMDREQPSAMPTALEDLDTNPALHTYDPAAAATQGIEGILAPTAPMLRRTLALQRSLRPLKRSSLSRHRQVLDEVATAARSADRPDIRPFVPVMRPTKERWLSLSLVIDTGPSMRMWHSLAHELVTLLHHLGAFARIDVWWLEDTSNQVRIRPGRNAPAVPPAALVDPAGRHVVAVLSDCSGDHWWSGRAQQAVRLWAGHGPTAVLQPLAERLWRRTAAPPRPGRISARRPGAPNSELTFRPYDGWSLDRDAVPVPYFELTPEWLANWARLIADGGRNEYPAAAAGMKQDESGRLRQAPSVERKIPIRERVLRFQSVASREAAYLAAYTALSIPALSVMRLIQERKVPISGPNALAEVLLSGLLRPVDDSHGLYDFVDGARDALLQTLPFEELASTRELLAQLSEAIQRRVGTDTEQFPAFLQSSTSSGRPTGISERPFALLSQEALRFLKPRAIPTRLNSDRAEWPDASSSQSSRTAAQVSTLFLGEIYTGFLNHSQPLAMAQVREGLSSLSVDGVASVGSEPPVRVVSSINFTGVDCDLPSASRKRIRGIGTVATNVVVTDGQVMQGTSLVRVVESSVEDRQGWGHYLAQPGTVEVIRFGDLESLGTAFLAKTRTPRTLDLPAITERAVTAAREALSLDLRAPIGAHGSRLRFVLSIGSDAPLGVRTDKDDGVSRRKLIEWADAPVETVVKFCEDLALRYWLLDAGNLIVQRLVLASRREIKPLSLVWQRLALLWPPHAGDPATGAWLASDALDTLASRWDYTVRQVHSLLWQG